MTTGRINQVRSYIDGAKTPFVLRVDTGVCIRIAPFFHGNDGTKLLITLMGIYVAGLRRIQPSP